ncbi:MAG: methionyl-tRNA formyltransferase [Clostridia bacterium]|nr:methionyl-tRNA formyltransferase [Clostridia bacterium]
MKIVFMGTPEFAVPCIKKIISDGHDVLGVFTQPDKPKGRGYTLTPPPVKVTALENNIPVYQPSTLKDGEALNILKTLNPQLIIVVAYGKILPKDILDLPQYGCVNIHASVLPKYRGAAPIQWSVINGDKQTGVTSMYMEQGLDTGDMLITETLEIGENETAGELHDRLSILGADVLSQTIIKIKNGELIRRKQDDNLSTYSPMLDKSLCPINWNESAQTIHNKIRGLSPWPVATANFEDKILKIHSSVLVDGIYSKPGEVILSDNRLIVCCGDGKCIEILQIQAQGSKRMSAQDFLRGHKIEKGTLLK